jgi:hypothetical protein
MEMRSLEAIFSALNDAQVRYIVVGGLAVVAHGYVRTTGDVDLVISLERDNIIRGLLALQNIGYRMAIPVTVEQFADKALRETWRKEKGMLVLKMWGDKHHRTPIDVFVYEPFDMDQELPRAAMVEWSPTIKVPVVSLPTLIKMKKEASRPQDIADVAELEKELS